MLKDPNARRTPRVLWVQPSAGVRAGRRARESAREIRKRLGGLDAGLAGLYVPREGHAKDVSDWL